MSKRRLASSEKIVSAPDSILSGVFPSSTIRPPVELCAPKGYGKASCSDLRRRAHRTRSPAAVIRRSPRPRACSGRILFRRREGSEGDDHAARCAHPSPRAQPSETAHDAADSRLFGRVNLAAARRATIFELILDNLTRRVGVDHKQLIAGELRKLA